MSRLYYSTPRDEAELASGRASGLGEATEKVAKLIPGEVIAIYAPVIALVPLIGLKSVQPWAYLVIFVIFLVGTPFYLNKLADRDKPKKVHLIVSTLAFPVWAYTVSGQSVLPRYYDPAIASIILFLFTFISGAIPSQYFHTESTNTDDTNGEE